MSTLILTLRLDEHSQDYFERLRQLHFPPKLNQITAHLTLFHQLPDTALIADTLKETALCQNAFSLQVSGLRSLGKGVAFTLTSPVLQNLHQRLMLRFASYLIPQDKQPFYPHVVVQNKATPDAARALLNLLQQDFIESTVQAEGLDLWLYLNGPWKHQKTFAFSAPEPT